MLSTLIKREVGNLIIHVYTTYDEDPDLSYLEQDYDDCTPKEQAKYQKQDRERLEAYRRGDWCMLGVCCDISIKTKTNWVVPTVVGRSSIWGVESDSGENYLMELAEDQIRGAKADLENLKKALCEKKKGH